MTVRWENQGCPKIKYDVEYSIRHRSGRPKLVNTQVSENFLEIKNLLPKTTISIRLRARREKNVSDFTDFARIIIPHTNETKDFTFDPDSAHQKLSLERVFQFLRVAHKKHAYLIEKLTAVNGQSYPLTLL